MMRSVPRRVEPEVRKPVQLSQYQAERLDDLVAARHRAS
jgi:hypothetical protein